MCKKNTSHSLFYLFKLLKEPSSCRSRDWIIIKIKNNTACLVKAIFRFIDDHVAEYLNRNSSISDKDSS